MANFSRVDALKWLNAILESDFRQIEDCRNGAIYCQLFECIHPGAINLNKVKFDTVLEHEAIQNYKLLQKAFQLFGVNKDMEIAKLTRGGQHFELLKWFKDYYEEHNKEDEECGALSERRDDYMRSAGDMSGRRSFDKAEEAAKPERQQHPNAGCPTGARPRKRSSTQPDLRTEKEAVTLERKYEAQIMRLKDACDRTINDNEFYLGQLQRVEAICKRFKRSAHRLPCEEALNELYRDSDGGCKSLKKQLEDVQHVHAALPRNFLKQDDFYTPVKPDHSENSQK